jgi:hypothetical protein
MALTAENLDTDGFHDNATNNTRVTIPSGLSGNYLVLFSGLYVNNATGVVGVRCKVNGSTTHGELKHPNGPASGGDGNHGPSSFALLSLSTGDYVEVEAFQTSGAGLNAQCQLAVIRLGTSKACHAYTTTGNSLASGAYGVVNLDAETVDTDNQHDPVTNNSRVAVPDTADYLIFWRDEVASTSAQSAGKLRLNGTTDVTETLDQDKDSTVAHGGASMCIKSLNASDYLELLCFQDSGANQVCKGAIGWVKLPAGAFYAQAIRGTTQGLSSGLWNLGIFDSETHDTDSMHDNVTNNTRLTVSHAGDYLLFSNASLLGVASPRAGGPRFKKNGSIFSIQNVGLVDAAQTSKTNLFSMSSAVATDYFETEFWDDPANTAQATRTLFLAIRLDDLGGSGSSTGSNDLAIWAATHII